jgi:hypothetical protein
MSSEVFVWVNLGFGFLLILLIWIGKRGALKPSALNLRRGSEAGMKNLNVIFMFNGHTFDAYEVLGVPAGSQLEAVEKAYREMTTKSSGDAEFFAAAISAIRDQVRRS